MSITVGQRASRSLTLTAEHVRKYAEISGDHNPLHFDAAFAARTKFGRLVVQGGLTTGLVHALVAMDMPGPGTVFLSQIGSSPGQSTSTTPSLPKQRSCLSILRNR